MASADPLRIVRLDDACAPEFDALVRLYEDVLPVSERKDRRALEAMLARDACIFSVGKLDGEVACFAIQTLLASTDACLLEYMGVQPRLQGRGLGGAFFSAVSAPGFLRDRIMLLEVEAEAEAAEPAEQARRLRRKQFYRRLGCRQVSHLTYVIPDLGGGRPPQMNLLLCGREAPAQVSKRTVTGWIEAIYAQVYGRPSDDPLIVAMLSGLPDVLSAD